MGNNAALPSHLAMAGWLSCRARGREAAEHPTVHRMAFHNKEVLSPNVSMPKVRDAMVQKPHILLLEITAKNHKN